MLAFLLSTLDVHIHSKQRMKTNCTRDVPFGQTHHIRHADRFRCSAVLPDRHWPKSTWKRAKHACSWLSLRTYPPEWGFFTKQSTSTSKQSSR